jgi:hypothetical protein
MRIWWFIGGVYSACRQFPFGVAHRCSECRRAILYADESLCEARKRAWR